MIIKYNKKRLNYSLFFGLLWLVIGLLGLSFKEKLFWPDYVYLVLASIYLGIYFYEKKYHYLTIENGTIAVNKPFGKKLNLAEIIQIKKFVGDYIVKSNKMELTINTETIDPASLLDLNVMLEKLNLDWK